MEIASLGQDHGFTVGSRTGEVGANMDDLEVQANEAGCDQTWLGRSRVQEVYEWARTVHNCF